MIVREHRIAEDILDGSTTDRKQVEMKVCMIHKIMILDQ